MRFLMTVNGPAEISDPILIRASGDQSTDAGSEGGYSDATESVRKKWHLGSSSMGGIRSRPQKWASEGAGRTAQSGPLRSGLRQTVATAQASLIEPALGSPVSFIQRTSSTCIFRLALRAALSSMRLRVSPGSLARS